jgi:hypothetical protein
MGTMQRKRRMAGEAIGDAKRKVRKGAEYLTHLDAVWLADSSGRLFLVFGLHLHCLRRRHGARGVPLMQLVDS